MLSKTKLIFCLLLSTGVGVGCFIWCRVDSGALTQIERNDGGDPIGDDSHTCKEFSNSDGSAGRIASVADEPMTDERLSDALQAALSNESLDDAIALAERALLSTNEEIRAEALDVLGWFGEATMPEVTSFLLDRNEIIRNTALLLWKDDLNHIEDENRRAKIIKSACGAIRDHETIVDVAMELVSLDSRVAVDSLCSLMSEPGSPKDVAAREVYQFLTGEEYTDRNAALLWASQADDVD